MDAAKRFKVLVVGGGLGGLCLAQGLRAANIDVTVFERDAAPTARRQGYMLRINSEGSAALRNNLPDALWHRFIAARGESLGINFVSEQLETRDTLQIPHSDDPVRQAGSIIRATLRDILLGDLDESISFGRRLISYGLQRDGSVRCLFEDGSCAEGDLLIGADGVNSLVRDQLLPGLGRVPLDGCAIVAEVPFDAETVGDFLEAPLVETAIVKDRDAQGMFLAHHRAVGGGRDGRTDDAGSVFWSLISQRRRFPETLWALESRDLVRVVSDMTGHWHPRLRRLIAKAGNASALQLRASRPPDSWPRGPVTLLGDAVHAMPPTGGQGANTALRDAAVLCGAIRRHIAGHGTLQEALDAYHAAMGAYAVPAVDSSIANLQRMISRAQDPAINVA